MKRFSLFQNRRFMLSVVSLVLIATIPMAIAKEPKKANSTNEKTAVATERAAAPQGARENYLGVSLEPLHPAFAAQMPSIFEKDRGLLIVDVMRGSPAEQAGIKPYDVLLAYGKEKLQSPEQLAKFVHADKAGQKVTLTIIREGKPQDLSVTIGEQNEHVAAGGGENSARASAHWRMPQWLTRHPAGSNKEAAEGDRARWESFDSLTLKSLGKGRFKVEIAYVNKEGKMEQLTFEGTRNEIHKDITARKDLPQNERDHLLRSLDLREQELLYDFPGV